MRTAAMALALILGPAVWKGQFTVAGKPAAATIGTRTINGLTVTTLDTSGVRCCN